VGYRHQATASEYFIGDPAIHERIVGCCDREEGAGSIAWLEFARTMLNRTRTHHLLERWMQTRRNNGWASTKAEKHGNSTRGDAPAANEQTLPVRQIDDQR